MIKRDPYELFDGVFYFILFNNQVVTSKIYE